MLYTHPNQNNIFSVPVWDFMLNDDEIRHQSPHYINHILDLQKTEPSQGKSSIGGWQSTGRLHKKPLFEEFTNVILSHCTNILAPYNPYGDKPYIQAMWANINEMNNFNAHHTHDGVLSGVFYCKAPENSGNIVFVNPCVRSFNSVIQHDNIWFKAEDLKLIIFPSWLEHCVEPSMSEESRICISFNVGLVENA